MLLNMEDKMTSLELSRRSNNPIPFNIIELLRLKNEMLIDMPAYKCNNGVINKALQRTVKAVGEHRTYNKGVGTVATQTTPIEDRIAMLAEYSIVDADQIKHSGDINAARWSEAKGIIQGMGLTQANTLIHGNENKPEEFQGIQRRRNKLGEYVIDAEGTGDELTSIYLCALGEEYVHLIYPEGSKTVGVDRHDRGLVDHKDADGKEYPAYKDYFTAQYGIAVKAPDALIRIANIPIKTIDVNRLIDIILDAMYALPSGASTYCMYSNVDVNKKIDKAARDKINVVYTEKDPWGKPISTIRDLRCRRMDVITSAEGRVA